MAKSDALIFECPEPFATHLGPKNGRKLVMFTPDGITVGKGAKPQPGVEALPNGGLRCSPSKAVADLILEAHAKGAFKDLVFISGGPAS